MLKAESAFERVRLCDSFSGVTPRLLYDFSTSAFAVMPTGKQKAASGRAPLANNDHIFRIIDSDLLKQADGEPLRDQTEAHKVVRHPSDLDALNVSFDRRSTPSKKLIELIDDGEADPDIPSAQYEDEDGPEISELGEEMFRLLLYTIVFGTLWLCM